MHKEPHPLDLETVRSCWLDLTKTLAQICTELKTSSARLRRTAVQEMGLPSREDLVREKWAPTEDQKQTIRDICKEDPSIATHALVQRLNISDSVIKRFRKENGIERVQAETKDGRNSIEDRIVDGLVAGWSYQAIADDVGVEVSRVIQIDTNLNADLDMLKCPMKDKVVEGAWV